MSPALNRAPDRDERWLTGGLESVAGSNGVLVRKRLCVDAATIFFLCVLFHAICMCQLRRAGAFWMPGLENGAKGHGACCQTFVAATRQKYQFVLIAKTENMHAATLHRANIYSVVVSLMAQVCNSLS